MLSFGARRAELGECAFALMASIAAKALELTAMADSWGTSAARASNAANSCTRSERFGDHQAMAAPPLRYRICSPLVPDGKRVALSFGCQLALPVSLSLSPARQDSTRNHRG